MHRNPGAFFLYHAEHMYTVLVILYMGEGVCGWVALVAVAAAAVRTACCRGNVNCHLIQQVPSLVTWECSLQISIGAVEPVVGLLLHVWAIAIDSVLHRVGCSSVAWLIGLGICNGNVVPISWWVFGLWVYCAGMQCFPLSYPARYSRVMFQTSLRLVKSLNMMLCPA